VSMIAQVLCVVATLVWVVVAMFIVRALLRLRTSLDQAEQATDQIAAQLAELPRVQEQAHSLCLESFYRVQAAHAWTVQVEAISVRSASLASLLIDELETPLLRALRVVRGVRAAVGQVLESWARPVDALPEAECEPIDRWLDDGGMPAGRVGRVGRTRPLELERPEPPAAAA